jgi:hypothetical protein
MTGHLACRFNDFTHSKALAVPQIVATLTQPVERFHGQNVSTRQIKNVDVITHTRPITGRIVITKYGDIGPLDQVLPEAQ